MKLSLFAVLFTLSVAQWVEDRAAIIFALKNYYRSGCVFLATLEGAPGVKETMDMVHMHKILADKGSPSAMLDTSHLTDIAPVFICKQNKALYSLLTSGTESRHYIQQTFSMLHPSSSIWLLFLHNSSRDSIDSFFGAVDIPFDCEFVVATVHGQLIELWEVFRVSIEHSLEVSLWGNWTKKHGLQYPSVSLYRRRNNLRGLVFAAFGINYQPFTIIDETFQLRGFIPEIIRELSDTLNFSYVIHVMDNFGVKENGSWSGAVGMLISGAVNFSVSIIQMTVPRWQDIDFTNPIINTSTPPCLLHVIMSADVGRLFFLCCEAVACAFLRHGLFIQILEKSSGSRTLQLDLKSQLVQYCLITQGRPLKDPGQPRGVSIFSMRNSQILDDILFDPLPYLMEQTTNNARRRCEAENCTKYTIYIRTPYSSDTTWSTYLSPYHSTVWITIAVVIILCAFMVALLQRLTPGYPHYDLSEILLCFWGSFWAQGHYQTPQRWSTRWIHWTSFATGVFILALYSANFVSFLTVPKIVLPFRNMKGILEDSTYSFGLLGYIALFQIFRDSNDEVMSRMFNESLLPNRRSLPTSVLSGFHRVCKEKFAFMTIYYDAIALQENITCDLTELPEDSLPIALAIPLPKRCPYKGIINFMNLNNHEFTGIMTNMALCYSPAGKQTESLPWQQVYSMSVCEGVPHWLQRMKPIEISKLFEELQQLKQVGVQRRRQEKWFTGHQKSSTHSLRSVHIQDVLTLFYVCFGGVMISVTIFLAELCISRTIW